MKAVALALMPALLLCGCGEPSAGAGEGRSAAASCVDRLGRSLVVVAPSPTDPVRIRYLFNASRMTPEAETGLMRNGFEGVRSITMIGFSGGNSRAAQEQKVDELMDGRSVPQSAFLLGDPPRFVFAPPETVPGAVARQQLGRMCGMISRGLELERVSVSPGDGTA